MASDFDDYRKAATTMGESEVSHLALLWWPDIYFETKPRILVKGILGIGECSLWYGDSGTGKSFVALDLGLHAALGWPWFGRKTTRALVVYIAAEAGGSIRRRVAAFRQHHGLSLEDDIPFALIVSPINLLDATPDLPALIHEIEQATAKYPDLPSVIIIDTLSRALAGGNENMPDDMGNFIRHVDRLRQATGAHVLMVHHTGKTLGQGARGHSLLRAAVDTEIEISRSAASKQSVALTTKQRDDDAGTSIAFRLRVVELGYDDDGDMITSCVVAPIDGPVEAPAKPKQRKVQLSPIDQRSLEFLRDTIADLGKPLDRPGFPNLLTVSLDEWRDRLKQRGLYDGADSTSRSRFLRTRERLVGEKLITIDGERVWPVPRPTIVTPFPGPDP